MILGDFEDSKRFLVIFRTLPKNFRKFCRVLEIFGDFWRVSGPFWRFPRSFSEFRRFLDIIGEFSETFNVF